MYELKKKRSPRIDLERKLISTPFNQRLGNPSSMNVTHVALSQLLGSELDAEHPVFSSFNRVIYCAIG